MARNRERRNEGCRERYNHRYKTNPECRRKINESHRRSYQKHREKRLLYKKEYFQRPEIKARVKAYYTHPNIRARKLIQKRQSIIRVKARKEAEKLKQENNIPPEQPIQNN